MGLEVAIGEMEAGKLDKALLSTTRRYARIAARTSS